MSGAGRAGAAGVVLVVLAPLTACSALGVPAAPRTPAPVQASWPGCEAVGAFPEDGHTDEPSGVGSVPAGFTATKAVLCEQGERTNGRGDTVGVDLERTATGVAPLVAYLAQPDERPTSGACTADGWTPPSLYLLDADGRYLAPAIPVDGCGKPLGWNHRDSGLAWEKPAYTDVVVREDGVSESAEAKRAGCSMQWKDAVDVYARSSHRRSGRFGADLPAGRALSVCVFEVPAADRGTDAAGGDFVSGRTLDDQDRAALATALRASSETPARCTVANKRFATVAPAEGGPTVYVELDGCRRAVSDGESTPVVRAGDDLVALLGG